MSYRRGDDNDKVKMYGRDFMFFQNHWADFNQSWVKVSLSQDLLNFDIQMKDQVLP